MAIGSYLGPISGVLLHLSEDDEEPLDFTAWDKRFDYPFIQSITVEAESRVSNTIQVSISPPFSQWVKFTNDYIEYFAPGNVITVRLGYSGDFGYRNFSAVVSTVSASVEKGFVSMDIEARGWTYDGSRVRSTMYQTQQKIIDYLEDVSRDRGLHFYVYDSDSGRVPINILTDGSELGSYYSDLFNETRAVLHGSVYSNLRKVIEVYAGYEFYVEGQSVVIVNPVITGNVRQMPTFQFGGKFDPRFGIYPLISFDSSDIQMAYQTGAHALSSNDYDPDDKGDPIREDVDRSDDEVRVVNSKRYGIPERSDGLSDSNAGEFDMGRNIAIPSRNPNRRAMLAASKRFDEQLSGIQATIETMGNPDLNPLQPINVQGLPDLFNGVYRIKKVTHSGGSDAFTTTLEILSGQWSDEDTGMLSESDGDRFSDDIESEGSQLDDITIMAQGGEHA